MILAAPGVSGQACGKAILIGEHAAVAGYPAIALPLRSQTLKVTFYEPLALSSNMNLQSEREWIQAWNLVQGQTQVELLKDERERLTKSLGLGLQLLSPGNSSESLLTMYQPQRIEICSEIPLGAGMGGSAALSAALLDAISRALNQQRTPAQIGALANELDSFFHGRASGLDAATVVSQGIIAFQRDRGAEHVFNKNGFWLLLIDTGERTPTRVMVESVAQLRERDCALVDSQFHRIGELSQLVRQNLQRGDLLAMGQNLNDGHDALKSLGVSTESLDVCVEAMLAAGALGAKLTGGGGGGLALAVFESRPVLPFSKAWADAPHYLTFVPSTENP